MRRCIIAFFANMCQQLGIAFDKTSFLHLLQEWYYKPGRRLQAVHPRDILKIAMALCSYQGVPCILSPALIDESCRAYFVQRQTSDGKLSN